MSASQAAPSSALRRTPREQILEPLHDDDEVDVRKQHDPALLEDDRFIPGREAPAQKNRLDRVTADAAFDEACALRGKNPRCLMPPRAGVFHRAVYTRL